MFPIIQIGPLALQASGLVLLVGLWIGLLLSERRASRMGDEPGDLYNLVLISILAGVIGARLSYAITYPDAFSGNLINLVSLNPGLLDPFAGALIGLAAGAAYIIRKEMPLWKTLDNLTPLFAVMAIAIGISHLASGNAFGKPTELPWGIQLWGAKRHPAQVYEILFAILILAAVYIIDKTQWNQVPGNIFLLFVFLTASARLFLEAFRGDSPLFWYGIRLPQVFAWLILAICLGIFAMRIHRIYQDKGVG